MLLPPVLPDEDARLETLLRYDVLDTPAEAEFDELGKLAGQICGAPIALVTFMERERQWFKAKVGVEVSENARARSFCAHTLAEDKLFVVPDAAADPRFADHPLVAGEPHVRFYAGSPLVAPNGQIIGTLCVLDVTPHHLENWQLEALATLSRQVMAQLELRLARNQERLREAEKLRETRARLENIAANLPGMVYQFKLHPDGRHEFPFVGETCREFNGTEAAQIMADPDLVTQAVHPDERADYLRSIQVSAEQLSPWNWQGRILLPHGQIKWVQSAARPQAQPDGSVMWDGLSIDVTARIEAEAERDRFFTLPLCMLAIAGQDGYFKRLNPTFEKVLGWSEAELLGTPFMELVHPDDHSRVERALVDLAEGAPFVNVVNRFQKSDGIYLDLQWTSVPHGDLIYTVAHDVTPLRQAQGALRRANDELETKVVERTAQLSATNAQLQDFVIEQRKSEARVAASARRVQSVLESISDAFFSFDRKWRYTYINEEAERLLGCARADLLGREVWECSPEMRDSALETELRRAAQSGEAATFETFFAPWNTWIEAHVYPSDEGLSVYFQDISARRENQIALETAHHAADAANRAKSEFLSQMSHELRTPLNSILGFAQILEIQELDDLERECTAYILKSGQLLLDLINEILDIVRVEAAETHLALEPLDLTPIVGEVCALVRPLANERALTLQQSPLPTQPHVQANAQRLKQVLLNLLSNAIKYNNPGGHIELFCQTQTDGTIQLGVRDDGIGIAPEHLPQLFQPFERGSAANSNIPGTGLGLALSRQLTEAMGGTLKVQSELGHGSTFTIELPVATALVIAQETLAIAIERVAPCACSYRILYIEDDDTNRRLIERAMESRPELMLFTARAGESGWQAAHSQTPDLILLDMNLPDCHGTEILRRLQSSDATREIPVLVLSADGTPAQIHAAKAAGARDYLLKPVDVAGLFRAVDAALEIQRMRMSVVVSEAK